MNIFTRSYEKPLYHCATTKFGKQVNTEKKNKMVGNVTKTFPLNNYWVYIASFAIETFHPGGKCYNDNPKLVSGLGSMHLEVGVIFSLCCVIGDAEQSQGLCGLTPCQWRCIYGCAQPWQFRLNLFLNVENVWILPTIIACLNLNPYWMLITGKTSSTSLV